MEDGMYTLLILLFLLVSFLMVIVILMQSSKGHGLASSFGGLGGGAFLGARGTANFLQKSTMVLGITYGVLCIVIGLYISSNSSSLMQRSESEEMFEKMQNMPTTVAPAPFDVQNAQPVPESPQNGQPENNNNNNQ